MAEKKDTILPALLPGLIGGGVFVLFTLLMGFNYFFISAGLGLAAFIGSSFLFGGKSKELEIVVNGITREKYNEIIQQGKDKLKMLASFISQVQDIAIKKKIKEISDVVEKIFLDIEKDPKDIKPAREFLSYYLDTTINILNRYTEISSQNIRSKKIDETLKKVEDLLDAIKVAFEKQLEKLLNDDILDLDSDIKVLEQTIKSEMIE
jgi:5-bromo-4-chloroindolyl phosphate hydrolysis protein